MAALLLTGPVLAGEPGEPDAAAILKDMANFLAGLQNFACTSRNGYEVLQSNGQKIEFGETRRMTIARPGRLRVEEVSSDGVHDLALFDGKLVTVFNSDEGVYAQAPQPPAVDDALMYFTRELHMRMPLALLLSTHVRTDLAAMVKKLDYVESTEILGVPAHHIAGRTDTVDFQMWIAEGKRPLPLRVVITYTHEPGQPRFWSDITDWNTSPKLASSTFQLALPKDARKIAFAVQVARPGEIKP
jgi:hypothetical protein